VPHTLAHLGVQGFLGRAAAPRVDVKWIALGCVLPDLPWIVQRALRRTLGALGLVDPRHPLEVLYDLRLYAVVQASLAWCLLLALAVATLARSRSKVFGVLALGAVLHLLLDALETRWGNGVLLWAPFDWRDLDLEWFWPESIVAVLLGALGVAWVASTWRAAVDAPAAFDFRRARLALAALLAVAYLATPLLFLDAAQATGNHSIDALRAGDERGRDRTGRDVELHRAFYRHRDGVPVVRTVTEEELQVPGLELEHGARVSLRGRFVAPQRLEVEAWHQHRAGLRDAATYLGLLAVAVPWVVASRRSRRATRDSSDHPPQGSDSASPPAATRR
jgi:hypothetical protein